MASVINPDYLFPYIVLADVFQMPTQKLNTKWKRMDEQQQQQKTLRNENHESRSANVDVTAGD